MRIRRRATAMIGLAMAAVVAMGGCDDDPFFVGDGPAPPRNFDARYFAGAVELTWELHPQWDGESFRVYGKRTSDFDYFLIAEVTNCAQGLCSYQDVNIVTGVSYEYYVAAVDPVTGEEASSENSVVVDVPDGTGVGAPTGTFVVALDNAAYLIWDSNARDAAGFSFYRVYVEDGNNDFLLGETDSEGFLDLLAANGVTYTYRVTAVDEAGQESGFSQPASGTPRPDFSGEWIYAYQDIPERSGFRFQQSEDIDPLVDGDAGSRHFRLEVDSNGWWLVPGNGTEIHAEGFVTTALKCGVAADAGCTSLDVAPTSGYTTADVPVFDQTTYPMRVVGDDGQVHYGVIRVQLLGGDQDGNGIMIFDWAYQLQAGNANLAPSGRAILAR